MDEALVKFVFGLVAVVVAITLVVYAIFIAIAIAAFVTMLICGVISFLSANFKKPLVHAQRTHEAFVWSLGWASVLTTGCMLGSFALFWALALYQGDALGSHMSAKYGEVYDFKGFALNVYNWLLVGAYPFFIKMAAVIFITNRVAVLGGREWWLGAIPFVGGALISFIVDHWELVLTAVTSHPHLEKLGQEAWAVLRLPVDLAMQGINKPDLVIQWGVSKFKESDGSMFKISEVLYPTIFSVLAALFGLRGVTGNIDASN